ncbi:hypothetical protein HPP92_001031 [Vanilla planifolia]|uniref:YacP-like NYN domain protein n=1 Tax=Vanilla planifolia TaxID=51239 RepID=A0A835RZ59_VANPL|nr:hypothetical protein HPP92_001031 [Vanilla planifolia]
MVTVLPSIISFPLRLLRWRSRERERERWLVAGQLTVYVWAGEVPRNASMRTNITFAVYAPTVMIRSEKLDPEKDCPPRITKNIKQNLQLLRFRDFQKRKSSTHKPATSYRKKKAVKEALPEDHNIYQDSNEDLYYTNQGLDVAVPVFLVDGYNVCGYWSRLKKHFASGRLDIARQKLIDDLIMFSVLKEVKVVVVFDALMSGLPTHKENFAGIDVIFTGESCADAWIEKEVAALKEDGCPRVWVVTSDFGEQQAAYGLGAFVWSCKALVSEIKASQRDFQEILEHRPNSMQGKLLQHNLDSKIVDALKDLKKLLPEM